ncbi:MAG: NOP5/NOP56 family protein [Halobacteriaceae archaeon]
MDADAAWFADTDPTDLDALATRINEGQTDTPADWPAAAVETGYVPDQDAYYEVLHEATMTATKAAATTAERADDQQLIHTVRAMDDVEASANELAERVAEWAASRREDAGTGIAYARDLATETPTDDIDAHLVSLAETVTALADERDALRSVVEQRCPAVAPNLAALAGPVLAARLIALAGGLSELAKLPSGTVQVLGAEDALFAHLSGDAPSPKHGVIYTHPYVRNTAAAHRGSAARAVAGKLTIAARIDHYAGDYRPDLERELDDRIATIRARPGEATE